MAKAIFEIDIDLFKTRALSWAQQFEEVCFFQSNSYADQYGKIASLLAVQAVHKLELNDTDRAFAQLDAFKTEHQQAWLPGFLSYDLKKDAEGVSNGFANEMAFPEVFFFVPSIVIRMFDHSAEIDAPDPSAIFLAIQETVAENQDTAVALQIKKKFSKTDYLQAFEKMQAHIKRGDIYEVNLCQEFYADHVSINPLQTYNKLNRISPTPFSCFFKWDGNYILSASPERFLAKRGDMLVSQPIKGTAPRGSTPAEDKDIIKDLLANPKEIAENVMIVDLVRNDLTKSALPGKVDASRRLELHSFRQVHQLISTVQCQKNPLVSDVQAIKNTFPAGSMTGAPKIKAMELCERYEASKRGIYAGALGYFSPDGDFDFNVVIRSLLYNSATGRLSFHTGGAITLEADAEKEYAECQLKASAILQTLNATLKED